jgi:hypothetical protein
MASGEIQFYMTESDERDFAEFLFSKFDAAILDDGWFESDGPEIYSNAKEFLARLSLPRNGICGEPRWVIWFKDIGDFTPLRFMFQGRINYTIRYDSQPIVEFRRSFLDGDVLNPGRFAYLIETMIPREFRMESAITEEQEIHLKKNFGRLRRWAKKYGEPSTWDGERKAYNSYIFPGAKQAFMDGKFLYSKRMQMVPPGFAPHEFVEEPGNRPEKKIIEINGSAADWEEQLRKVLRNLEDK